MFTVKPSDSIINTPQPNNVPQNNVPNVRTFLYCVITSIVRTIEETNIS